MQYETAIDEQLFRTTLGSYATGVAVVTCLDTQGLPTGMTINSFASLSLSPPLVLWSIDKQSDQFRAFAETTFYAVNVLSDSHQDLARHFAARQTDKFADIEYMEGLAGLPLLTDCCALLQCRVRMRHEAGDHVILIGEVLETSRSDRAPLIFHGGRYRALAGTP